MSKRCYNCFESVTTAKCKSCGFSNSSIRPNNSALKPGTLLDGRYFIGRVLGQGGFGITYVGFDDIMGGVVAIKEHFPKSIVQRAPNKLDVLTDSKAEFSEGLKKFTDEAKALARFQNHPNIVSVVSYQRSNNTAYMIMDYIEGKTVKDILSGGKSLPVKDSCEIILQVLDGLGACHQQRLIHRDLTPDNIYITTKGGVKILDFGSARETVEGGENEFTQVLKKSYAPIEQFQHGQSQGPWTDIYSVGASFYRLITGKPPALNSVDRLLNDNLKKPSQIKKITDWNPDLEAVLMKSIEVRPENRYQSVDEFKVDLLNATSASAPSSSGAKSTSSPKNKKVESIKKPKTKATKKPPTSKKATKSKSQNLNPAALVAGIALISIGGVIFFNINNDDSSRIIANNSVSQSSSIAQRNNNIPESRTSIPKPDLDEPPRRVQPAPVDITPAGTYLVNFSVQPTNAKLFLNGKEISKGNNEINTGDYELKIIASGYASKTIPLRISSNSTKSFSLVKYIEPTLSDIDVLERLIYAPGNSENKQLTFNASTGLDKSKLYPQIVTGEQYSSLIFDELEFDASNGDGISSFLLGMSYLENTKHSKKNITKARSLLNAASVQGLSFAKGYLALIHSCNYTSVDCNDARAQRLISEISDSNGLDSYFGVKYLVEKGDFNKAKNLSSQLNIYSEIGSVLNLIGKVEFGQGSKPNAIRYWEQAIKLQNFNLESMLLLGIHKNNDLYIENAYREGLTEAKKYYLLNNFDNSSIFNRITKTLALEDPQGEAFFQALKIISDGSIQRNKSKFNNYINACKYELNCIVLEYLSGIKNINTASAKSQIKRISNSSKSDLLPELKGASYKLLGDISLNENKLNDAEKNYLRAFELGFIGAGVDLCNYYAFIDLNPENTKKYCDETYEKGSRDPILLSTLAHTYIENKIYKRPNKNLSRAATFLNQSCSMGNATACCTLANIKTNKGEKTVFLNKAKNLNLTQCRLNQ